MFERSEELLDTRRVGRNAFHGLVRHLDRAFADEEDQPLAGTAGALEDVRRLLILDREGNGQVWQDHHVVDDQRRQHQTIRALLGPASLLGSWFALSFWRRGGRVLNRCRAGVFSFSIKRVWQELIL